MTRSEVNSSAASQPSVSPDSQQVNLRAPHGVVPKSVLESLFGCQVVVVQAAPQLVDPYLYADECAYVARALPKRRAEFGTARVCARQALRELGISPRSLVPDPDRAPRWPVDTVGSISHTEGYCAVVVALASQASGLGLDVEHDGALQRELERLICTERERRWLDRWAGDRRGRMAKLIFSAKEAFYKCQYRTTRSFLDFAEVDLDVDLAAETFRARVHREGAAWRFVEQAQGRLLWTANLVITSATLEPCEQHIAGDSSDP